MSTPQLDDLRRQIDEIDDRLHDLLMKRMEIVNAIAVAKAGDGTPALRPGREAMILRRLVARHGGALPRAVLIRIWREMLSAAVGLQTKFAVAVYAPDGEGAGYWDLARDHFGSHTPMTPFQSIGQVIRTVTDGQANIGVLPMPREDDHDPWWRFIVSNDEATPRALARLPFAARGNARSDCGDALAIGRGTLEATGSDHSLLVFETRGEISRARIFSGLAVSRLDCTFFAAYKPSHETTLNLVEVSDFVLADDPRIAGFKEQVEATAAVERIVSLGAYAAPLGINETDAMPQRRQA